MEVNKNSLVEFSEVCVILRNDKEFVFKPDISFKDGSIESENRFSTRKEYNGNKIVDFIEIIRVTYTMNSVVQTVVKHQPLASFYRNDVKHYAVVQ